MSDERRPTWPNSLANKADRVLVGQASRHDAHNRSRREVREEVHALKQEINEATAARLKIEARLKGIVNEIRGEKLPKQRYDFLCKEQHASMNDLARLQSEIADKRLRVERLSDEEFLMTDDFQRQQLAAMEEVLKELRIIRSHLTREDR